MFVFVFVTDAAAIFNTGSWNKQRSGLARKELLM